MCVLNNDSIPLARLIFTTALQVDAVRPGFLKQGPSDLEELGGLLKIPRRQAVGVVLHAQYLPYSFQKIL
jgi:hypothetical protein